jgi:ATP-dependent DNA ligase
MLYDTLVTTYAKLEATTKRLEMTDILAALLKEASPDEIELVIYLTQGKIHPDWTGEPEIGMAERMVITTIVKATGLSKSEVEALLAEKGDIGIAAEDALKGKRLGRLGGKRICRGSPQARNRGHDNAGLPRTGLHGLSQEQARPGEGVQPDERPGIRGQDSCG